MKNSYIALAVFSMAALLVSSCETTNEIKDNPFIPGNNDIVFNLGNRTVTKSSDADFTTAKVATMDLGKHGNNSFSLDESVVNLNGFYAGPDTKGTPAYTENLGVLYKDQLGVYAIGGNFGTSEITFTKYAEEMVAGGWQYVHKYDSNPWPSSGSAEFYFRMPVEMNGVSVTGRTGGAFTFTYTTPESSTDQQDILFGYRSVSESEYKETLPDGLPVLLKHALTGVKFAVANDDITIKSITLDGLYNSGTCVISPTAENGGYTDITGTHSSKGDADWSGVDKTSTGSFTNDYSNNSGLVNFETSTTTGEGEDAVTTLGKFENNGNYPDSFAANGGKNNLNDADATQTFWFIPQAFEENGVARDITLTIVYSLNGSSTDEEPLVIDFGDVLAERDVVWEAGQLYTYTLKVAAVKVHIEDEITTGGSKQGIAIANTGNTDAFIRATIIGNWCAEGGEAVFGFTDFIDNPGDYVEIPSWTVDNPGGGVFRGLPGTGWVRATDGFFYYTSAVAPGKIIGTAPTGATNAGDYVGTPLFISYTPPTDHPDYQIAGKYVDTHFVMEIATQAVSANDSKGTTMTWQEAWKEALGTAPATN